MTHTKLMQWEYYPETNIAGGPAGAAYSYTVAASAAELTLANLPFNETQIMPFHVYNQEALEHAGQDVATRTTMTKGLLYKDGKIVQHMQSGTWLDWALGISPAETGAGAVPPTFLFQWTNGIGTYTSYGCHIKKYTLNGTPANALKETIEFGHVKTEEEGATFDDPWYDGSTAVSNFEDVGTTSVTLDGNAVGQLNSFEVRIENKYSPEEAHGGAYYNKYPQLASRIIEVDIEFEADLYDEIWEAPFTTEAAALFTIIFTPLGKANLSLTNMKVKPGSSNINEVPEKGIMKWKGTLEIGGACVATTP